MRQHFFNLHNIIFIILGALIFYKNAVITKQKKIIEEKDTQLCDATILSTHTEKYHKLNNHLCNTTAYGIIQTEFFPSHLTQKILHANKEALRILKMPENIDYSKFDVYNYLDEYNVKYLKNSLNELTPKHQKSDFEICVHSNYEGPIWINGTFELISYSEEKSLIQYTFMDSTKRKQFENDLIKHSQTDQLTEIFNKATSKNLCEIELCQSDTSELYALFVLDLDNFKSINDSLGHLVGDRILKKFSDQLQSVFMSDDILGRVGGDEFIVLMKNVPNISIVEKKAELILKKISEIVLEENRKQISCSIGIALSPQHGNSYESLFAAADEALYKSKALGKNQFYFAD